MKLNENIFNELMRLNAQKQMLIEFSNQFEYFDKSVVNTIAYGTMVCGESMQNNVESMIATINNEIKLLLA